jgi:tetratricopeptide (TPR) repeat protein
MRSLEIVIRTIAVVAIIVFVSSCASKEAKRIMDTADAVMWTRPDSALAVLESIDTLSLKTKAQRARYSLLYTMALDRNHRDIPDLRIIKPAASYYERHGSNDDRMKMYFYLGVAQYDTGDPESAIASYLRAKEYSFHSDNLVFKGIISSSISDVYLWNNNNSESILYCKEACDYFVQAKDSFRLWNTTGLLANRYSNIRDWAKADSLYSIFFSQPIRDTSIYARQLLNLAWNNIFKPGSDPHESIDLFRKATGEFGGTPSLNDYCVYAYASEIIGDYDTANDLIRQLENVDSSSTILKIWKYRISKHRADYKTALTYLEQSLNDQNSEVLETVGQSVALAQSDYYENKSLLLDKDRRLQRQVKWMIFLIAVMMVASGLGIYSKRKEIWQRQVEEMSFINDEVSQRLNEAQLSEKEHLRSIDSLASANELAEKNIQTLSEKLSSAAEKEQVLMGLRAKYVQANKRRYAQLNVLCRQYLESPNASRNGKDKIYAEVKKILAILDEPNQKELESMLDDNLDGIMSKLRAAIPDTTEKDFRFISFLVLGFDTKTISRMMDYNVNTVYTKRYIIKEKISKLDGENKALFSEFIS